MSTEVTPESLRTHALYAKLRGHMKTAKVLDSEADDLERERRPLPTVPGWYPNVVVERGGESCTGALLRDDEWWLTALTVAGVHTHALGEAGLTVRWAEQDGKTPGLVLYEAWSKPSAFFPWDETSSGVRDRYERAAAAVLAAHVTPTLTPVGEHPEPGARGLLPVVCSGAQMWRHDGGSFICDRNSKVGRTVLADPRPDGAHE